MFYHWGFFDCRISNDFLNFIFVFIVFGLLVDLVIEWYNLLILLNLNITFKIHSITRCKLIFQTNFIQIFGQINLLNFLGNLGGLVKSLSLGVEFWDALGETLFEKLLFTGLLLDERIFAVLNFYYWVLLSLLLFLQFLFCYLLLKILILVYERRLIIWTIIIGKSLKIVLLRLIKMSELP